MKDLMIILNKIRPMKEYSNEETKRPRVWSRRVEENGMSRSVRVEEIDNGFIIEMNESGCKDGKYFDKTKKYYSKENPLANMSPDIDDNIEDSIKNFLNNF